MLIFIACEASSMNLKVLVLILTLIFTLEPLQVFNMLLLDPQLEVFELNYLLLVIVDRLLHAVFLTLDHE